MKVSKGQSQPEIVAAAFLILYMVLGSHFLVLIVMIVTHLGGTSMVFDFQGSYFWQCPRLAQPATTCGRPAANLCAVGREAGGLALF